MRTFICGMPNMVPLLPPIGRHVYDHVVFQRNAGHPSAAWPLQRNSSHSTQPSNGNVASLSVAILDKRVFMLSGSNKFSSDIMLLTLILILNYLLILQLSVSIASNRRMPCVIWVVSALFPLPPYSKGSRSLATKLFDHFALRIRIGIGASMIHWLSTM